MKRGTIFNERDDRGFRVPDKGTLSRDVYDLCITESFTPLEASELLRADRDTVRVLLYRIRNPQKANDMGAAWKRKKYWQAR